MQYRFVFLSLVTFFLYKTIFYMNKIYDNYVSHSIFIFLAPCLIDIIIEVFIYKIIFIMCISCLSNPENRVLAYKLPSTRYFL